MRKGLIRMLWALLIVCIALLVAPAFYNAWARRVLEKELHDAAREPGTEFLRGGAPIRIERGRSRACLLLHGFMSTPADFGALPRALDEAGWDVVAPVLPGHATDPRRLEKVKADDLVSAGEEEFLRLRQKHPTVAVVGFSLGGAIALHLSARHAPDALVLVNPYFASPYKPRYVLPPRWAYALLSPAIEYAVRPATIHHINRAEGAKEIVGYRVVPMAVFREVFAVADAASAIAPPDVPLLVLISEGDSTSSPSAVQRFYEAAPVRRKERKLFGRSDHMLFLDHDREEAVRAVAAFLVDSVQAPPYH